MDGSGIKNIIADEIEISLLKSNPRKREKGKGK